MRRKQPCPELTVAKEGALDRIRIEESKLLCVKGRNGCVIPWKEILEGNIIPER